MTRTYRDIRLAKYRRFVRNWSPQNYARWQEPRDLLVAQGDLEHRCATYCLIPWLKRIDRKKLRLQGKRWLKEERWRDAE